MVTILEAQSKKIISYIICMIFIILISIVSADLFPTPTATVDIGNNKEIFGVNIFTPQEIFNSSAASSNDSRFWDGHQYPSLTDGSVLFWESDEFTQDNSNFFWDDINKRLGLGHSAPVGMLDLRSVATSISREFFIYTNAVVTSGTALVQIKVDNTGATIPVFDIWNDGSGDSLSVTTDGTKRFAVQGDGGDTVITNADLRVDGNMYVTNVTFDVPSGIKGLFMKYNPVGDRGVIWSYNYIDGNYEELNLDASNITFEVSNAHKMELSSNGLLVETNVGILTNGVAPAGYFDIGGSTSMLPDDELRGFFTVDIDDISGFQFRNENNGTSAEMRFITAANDGSYLAFTQAGSNRTGIIGGILNKSNTSSIFSSGDTFGIPRDMYIGATATGKNLYLGAGDDVKMSILSSGKVGIGTATPTHDLNVVGSVNVTSNFTAIGTGIFGDIVIDTDTLTTSDGKVKMVGPNYPVATFERQISGTSNSWSVNRFQATSSGNMVDSFGPDFVFSIKDNAGVTNDIGIMGYKRDGSDTSGRFFIRTRKNGAYHAQGFNINKDNYVGMGTTIPNEELHVYRSQNVPTYVKIENPNSGTGAGAGFRIHNDNSYALATFYSSNFPTAADKFYIKNQVGDIAFIAITGKSIGFGVGGLIADAVDLVIASNNFVGVGTTTPLYPLEVRGMNVSDGNISIWAEGNISATGFITRTSIFDSSKTAFDYVKDSSYYEDNGVINHKNFYGYAGEFEITDYSRPVYKFLEFNETGIPEVRKVISYPYKTTEEGVSLDAEVNVLRQALFELNERVKYLEGILLK